MELTTSIDIQAPPEQVWEALTDFEHYPDWNPFMRVIGRPYEGARLHVELSPPGGRRARFRPTVTRAESNRELRWLGHLWTRGLFDGEHRFVLDPLDDGERTRLTHAESMTGVLTPLVWRLVGTKTERGFEAMNSGLKTYVESTAPRATEQEAAGD